MNIRGLDSKIVSLKSVLSVVSPDIVTLNETHYIDKKRINIEGYLAYQRNRKARAGGGIATLVSDNIAVDSIKVKEGLDEDEYLVTKHDKFLIPINVINVYGEAESRASNQVVEDRWFRIVSELKSIENKGEFALVIGDLNKHIGNVIKGNHNKVSFGGKLINDLLDTDKYVLLNASSKVKGGPFTRFDPSCPNDESSMSCIDLAIASTGLAMYLDEFKIDRNQDITPFRPLKIGCTFPDHFAIIIKFKDIPINNRMLKVDKIKRWNLNKADGWKNYTEITGNNKKLREIANDRTSEPTVIMKQIDRELTKAKFQAFGKVTHCKGKSHNKKVAALYNAKMRVNKNDDDNTEKIDAIDEQIKSVVLGEQKLEFEKKVEKLRNVKLRKGNCAALFSLKDDLISEKKSRQVAATLIDPFTNIEISDRKQIKDASLKYCVDLLTNRQPNPGYEDDINMKNLVHESRMIQKFDDEPCLRRIMFDASLKELSLKNLDKYKFIIHGGTDLKDALFQLFSTVWETEVRPQQWRHTTIVQLYKGKGDPKLLSNQRNIHTKLDVPKFFGHIVMAQCKGKILNSMTKFQIGTKVGHRPQEHIFTMKSVIALYQSFNLPVFVQFYDISKFFDRESLRDGLDALFHCGVQGKLYRLIYNMNKDTIIKVKTAVGETEEHETGENIGQGTLEGALLSAASLDYTFNKFFSSSSHELSYGQIKLQPLLFQDDIGRLSTSLDEVQAGNKKLENIIETKLLDFNLDKSCTLIMGSKSKRKQMKEQLQETPLMLCNKMMKVAEVEKYLGDYFSCEGLAHSVFTTVVKRKPQAMMSIFELKAIIEDCRANAVGGLEAGIDIWQLSIVPFLLKNSETWIEIQKKTLDLLDNIQLLFLRCLLKTPRTCLRPILLWDSGLLSMCHRIAIRKLMFLHHLKNLPHNSLAYEIMQVQETFSYPGLIKECHCLLEHYELPKPDNYSKGQWKSMVKKCVRNKARDEILVQMETYSKLDAVVMKKEEYSLKSYIKTLNIPDARLRFALRSKMTRTIKMNFKGIKSYAVDNWQCNDCKVPDTQEHVLSCPAYNNLRVGKDLQKDKDLVDYFRQIILLRSSDCSGT